MRDALLRSTPFRLVVFLGLAFVVTLGLSAVMSFRLIHENLMERIDQDLDDTAKVLSQSFDSNDLPDLLDLIDSHVRATVDRNQVYLLADQAGQVLAGNLARPLSSDGLSTQTAEALGIGESDGRYRVLQRALGEYKLVVGINLVESDEIGFLVLTVLAWTSVAFAIVILLLGTAFAIRGQRRLDVIAGTLDDVSRGNLAARIPASGRNDDIDMLVGRVNNALDRLASLVEGMRQVSADIAHELRTPLNRLNIILAGATEEASGDTAMTRQLEDAQAEVTRTIAIFDAMLRIAQIESGARKSRFTSVALGPLLETLADAYGPVATEQGQQLDVRLGDAGTVMGDRDLLVQAIANLIENAIRHCPKGASIGLEGRNDGKSVLVMVSDNGPGIPDADKPRVFDRLYRVEKSRTTPGDGLGLSLVRAVADLHGAKIELLDNHPGTVVVVRLPLQENH